MTALHSSSTFTFWSSSSAAANSTMEETSNNRRRRRGDQSSPKSTTLTTANPSHPDLEDGEGDPKIWSSFTSNFREVQSVLDRNRVLIQQVNENHQSKLHENLAKNVDLIQEINGNISKVVSLYSDFSNNFSGMFHGGSPSNSEEKQ